MFAKKYCAVYVDVLDSQFLLRFLHGRLNFQIFTSNDSDSLVSQALEVNVVIVAEGRIGLKRERKIERNVIGMRHYRYRILLSIDILKMLIMTL